MDRFATPQRQSPIGIVVMFFDTLQQYARALWPILLVYIYKFKEWNPLWLFLGGVLIFLLIATVAFLRYRNFTFFLDEGRQEFVLTEGILNKTRTTINLDKIQQVNIKQSLLQRLIGVYALDIDTAGTNNKEVSIKAIAHPIALGLKARLLDSSQADPSAIDVESAVAAPQSLISISLLSLLKVGITSNYVRSFGLLLAFFVTVYDNLMRFSNQGYVNEDQFQSYFERHMALQSFALLLVFVFGAILVVNLFRIVIRYFNYNISLEKGSLLLSFGLLNTKSTLIRPERVQSVSVTRNYFQRLLDVYEFKVRQATGGQQEARKQAVEIPGCDTAERDQILQLLFGRLPERGQMLKPNFRKLVFAIFLSIVLPLCGFYFLAGQVMQDLWALQYAVPVYVLLLLAVLVFGFRNYRMFIHEAFIIKQSGAWDVTNEIIAPQKIQALSVSQLFWHRSADIGYLTIHTAGGKMRFELGDFTTIKHYVNLWLYAMERSDSNWM